MISQPLFRASMRSSLQQSVRSISTLTSNPHIYIHPTPNPTIPKTYTLSLLPTSPPSPLLAIGTTTAIPPTPTSLTENPHFMRIVHSVIKTHAPQDPQVLGQAAAFASSSGANLGSGGSLFGGSNSSHNNNRSGNVKRRGRGDGAGGASSQGGAGGGGRGGWLHVGDMRAPPDFGRIAWPEDIFGSLEVDGKGEFVEGVEGVSEVGRYQESGSYRVVTREGILGLSDYLRTKVIERLREEEKKEKEQQQE